jgi:heme A synthase
LDFFIMPMKLVAPVSMAAALAVFIQLILGGSVTFGYLSTSTHLAFGYLAGVLVLVTFVLAVVTKPRDMGLFGVTLIALILIIVQGGLGMVAASSNSPAINLGHFVNGIVVFGLMVASTFYAAKVSRMSKVKVATGSPPTQQGSQAATTP